MPAVTSRSLDDEDYYRILGVSRDVGDEDLKRAYKRQALRWHPDKNQHRSSQAAERFKKVSEAYQALSNKQSRAIYNQQRPSAGNNEVLFSKTYGWPGANISFYWTGPAPQESDEHQTDVEQTESSRKAAGCQSEAKARASKGKRRPLEEKSPLELFADMFEIESPLAAFDRKLDDIRRQSSIFESVFGSFKPFESTQDQAPADAGPSQEEPHRQPWNKDQAPADAGPSQEEPHRQPWNKAGCSAAKEEKDKRVAFIKQEYLRGDLNEQEYKELIGLFGAL
jgi:curved DNA-binding protein CbpA